MSKKLKALLITIGIISTWLVFFLLIRFYPDVLEKVIMVILIGTPIIMIPILIYHEVLKELE